MKKLKSVFLMFLTVNTYLYTMYKEPLIIEDYTGMFFTIPYDIALQIKKFREHINENQNHNCEDEEVLEFEMISARPLRIVFSEKGNQHNAKLDKETLEIISECVKDPSYCSSIEPNSIKTIFDIAYFLGAETIMRPLTVHAKKSLSPEQQEDHAFIKKGIFLRSIKTLIQEECLNEETAQKYVDKETDCLNLSGKKLESLAGLKQLLQLLGKSKISKLNVNDNEILKFNYYKLSKKFNILNVSARNNSINEVVFPRDVITNASIDLKNNNIASFPQLKIAHTLCLFNLRDNLLTEDSLAKLEKSRLEPTFAESYKREITALRTGSWIPSIALPITWISLLGIIAYLEATESTFVDSEIMNDFKKSTMFPFCITPVGWAWFTAAYDEARLSPETVIKI